MLFIYRVKLCFAITYGLPCVLNTLPVNIHKVEWAHQREEEEIYFDILTVQSMYIYIYTLVLQGKRRAETAKEKPFRYSILSSSSTAPRNLNNSRIELKGKPLIRAGRSTVDGLKAFRVFGMETLEGRDRGRGECLCPPKNYFLLKNLNWKDEVPYRHLYISYKIALVTINADDKCRLPMGLACYGVYKLRIT